MPLHTLIVDFNSYFASVEQQERPELRGRPVAIVPVMTERTSCIAASLDAKRHGVKTGTPVAEARQMCPGLVVIEARSELYVQYHHRLVAMIERCVPVTEVLSIDEVRCDLPGDFSRREKAQAIAQQIKRTITHEAGPCLTSSIGIAPNAFLAKVASDLVKPDGLVLFDDPDLPGCLYELSLRDLPGIGHNMEQRLLAAGFDSVEKLCAASRADLRRIWGGIEGERFYDGLHGAVVYRPATQTGSTIGHSHVLPPDMRNESSALATLHRLLQKAAMRLRHSASYAGGLHLSLRYVGRDRWSDALTFLETQDTRELIRVFNQLWDRRPTSARAQPIGVGVTLFHLSPAHNHTATLFETGDARTGLNAAIDRLNRKLGKNTVVYGGALGALHYAPIRIAFNRIPDVALEGGETDDELLATPADIQNARSSRTSRASLKSPRRQAGVF
ncbi:DNA polymerase [Nibricoccus aquaticus]|uniref:DNA polymerase n=1 Tax=Nibricoccus aquaticus TaxID=2576891 RepID=A0A290QL31_9BACT|nr:helix-hairpin-helix domain-containing protein [Nibricoccus aquaticus]ATC65101.1 DNA polymerase [Nibricoccus aquaticus]